MRSVGQAPRVGALYGAGPGLVWSKLAAHRRVDRVLHLEPVVGPTADIGAVAALGDDAFRAKVAGLAKKIGADRSALERRNENAVEAAAAGGRVRSCAIRAAAAADPPRRSRRDRRHRAAPRRPAGECRSLKSARPPTPSTTASPSTTNCFS